MRKLLTLFSFFLALYSCNTEKEKTQSITIGDFTFSSEDINPSQSFEIIYNGKDSLQESLYHALKGTKTFPYDLEFKNNKASILIADSITAVAFNFKINDTYDGNNRKGYFFKVKGKNDSVAIDAEASLKYFAMTYGEEYNFKGDAKTTFKAIEDAITANPELENDWLLYHMNVAQKISASKSKETGNHYINKLSQKQDKTVEDFVSLERIYATSNKKELRDSIVKVASNKYPESEFAIRPLINSFFEAKSLTEKEKIFNSNKTKLSKSRYGSYIIETLASANFNNGNNEAFNKYFKMMKKNTVKASLLNSIAWSKVEKGQDLEAVSKLSKQSLDLIKEEQSLLNEKPDYLSTNQHNQNLDYNYGMYADTYALLQYKLGHLKDAISYQEQSIGKGNSPDYNERYIQFLVEDKQYKKASEKARVFIANGASTAKLKDYFKKAFTKFNTDEDFILVLAALEDEAKEKQLNQLRKKLLDEDAPTFDAKNLNGEIINLASLKGKTVILDFWATWCGPCIKSFPGMQKAVTKYKDNKDVVFLFIDTFESGDDRETSVKNFIEKNNYDFNVIFDPVIENSNNHEIAQKYNISGIPTKIIIGPDGRMKFKDVGFGGSIDKTLSKIDTMVKLLK